ncbi:MAG: class I SAM-dependent rRNA methyltransferase [Deltaproteobacteria bacterium]|nr:class I SAM-dependent rRNA methyltransferase [Deltaproteobacteria bacterium]
MPLPPAIRLTGKGRRWRLSGHPWIYRDDLAAEPDLAAGELVRVESPRGEFLGQAFYSALSRIALRFVTFDSEAVDDNFWAARLDNALALRARVVRDTDACRLIYGEADGFPGLVVDSYAGHLAVQVLHPGMERRLPDLINLFKVRLAPASITLRQDAEVRRLEGLPLEEVQTVWGNVPDPLVVQEGPVRCLVDIRAGQKTGLFLDQRENRLAAGFLARGEILDAFAYQGGFALHLAAGAKKVTLVESSAAALAMAQENARLNGIANFEPVRANVFSFLKKAVQEGRRYDVIVLDPPAFAKSRRDRPAALKGYLELNRRAFQLLRPQGLLVTCSCSYNVREEEFLDLVRQAAALEGRQARLLERRGAARDHPALLSLPESLYLKCLFVEIF